MKVKNLKNIRLFCIAIMFMGNTSYAQNTNMALPSQVGVYNPNIRTQQMQLPSQVGVYTTQTRQNTQYQTNQNAYRPSPVPVVNYNRDPVISERLYDEVNGYRTPNRYTLNQPKIIKTAYNNYGNRTTQQLANNSDDFGVEYYMALNFGMAYFEDGSNLTGNAYATNQFDTYYDFPLNNVKGSLDNGKNFSIGFGVMSNRKQKVELMFSNISGLNYGSYATAENQWCPEEFADDGSFYYDCSKQMPVEGGNISSSTFGINMYFPIDELIGGKLLDGMITPYIGGGIGITFNTIDDYTVIDDIGNGEAPIVATGDPYWNTSTNTACSASEYESNSNCVENWGYYDYDGEIYHYGATTNNVSWNLEAGLSFDLDSKTIVDVYFKHNNLGKIKSKGEVFSSYSTVDILDPTTELNTGNEYSNIEDYCTSEAIDAGFSFNPATGWCESEDAYTTEAIVYDAAEKGTLENNEIGVKLRLIF
ncbi:hypothetical protein HDR59_04015 [bacterium]|nr:hypothetical protein [bacterium]